MTKTNTRNRIVSILLVLVMLLTMVPINAVTANAADTSWTTVNTYDQLKAALSNQNPPDNIKLGSDIDTGTLTSGMGIIEPLEVKGRKQLDLNGHTLRMYSAKTAMSDMIMIRRGDLTVLDSSSGQKGTILGSTYNDSCYLFNIQYGKLTLNSGTLKVDAGSLKTENKWRRVIYCYVGGTVTINGGTLHVAPETYEGENNAYGQYFEEEYRDLLNGYCGYTLMAANSCKVSINGGTFQGPVRLDAGGSDWKENEPRIQINGGTFEKKVMLNGPGDGTKPLAEINGGTFLEYVQAWVAASFENSFSTSEVVINGGEFHKKFWLRPKFVDKNDKDLTGYHVAVKLNGGTFHETLSVDKQSSDYGYAPVRPRLSYSDVTFLADEMLGKNAVQTGKGTFAAQDTSSYREYIPYYDYNKTGRWSEGFVFEIKAVNNQPTTIIPNAWGMKSVTLDGKKIDYAKNWKGTVERMDNSTAHTLKFEWYPLASELVNEGYSYRTKCEHYISGSTAVQQTDTIAADKTSHTVTIPAGADPKVYSYDLHLNLDKNGSSVGIFSNEHIVKLVVSEAPPAPPAPVAHSITVTNGRGTANPTSAMAGETVTVKAKDDTANNMMFTRWNTETAGVTFADATKQETTFVMPDCDVKVNPGFQQVSFRKQPLDSWPQVNHGSKAIVTFSAPITKWELKEGNTTVASSGSLFINTGNPITVDIPAQSSKVEKTYTVVVTANGQKFSSNKFKVSWINWPKAPEVEFTPADGTQFVGKIEVIASDALYAGEEIFEIAYTTDGTDPKTSTTTIYANTDTEHITLTETTTIKARACNYDAAADAEKWGPLATATFTKYSDSTLPKPIITPEGMTYTGSIKAYLTAPALDGVKMEYCLMRTGDPNITGYWETYDPETGITVNDFGTITLYARTFKEVDAETPDGLYYVETLTSENASVTYTRTYSAAIDNVTVSGKVGKTMTQDVVIRMNGDRFENVTAGDDVSAWFNLPAGLTANVKELSNANGYHGTLTVTISGMPTATSAVAITVTIPKDKLYANNTTDLTVLSNPNAYYSIALDADHQHDYSGQPYLYLDPGNHYQECKAGDGYNIQAHEFTPWTDNGNGTHSHHCTVCKMTDGSTYTETAKHTWVWVVDQEAALNQPGLQHEECTGCHAKRSENTEIPALRDYAVTVTGGTATVAAGTTITRAMEGVEVTVTADAPETGKVFDKWVVKAGGVTLANETSATTTFTMPGNDVKIEATYKDAPPSHTHSYGTWTMLDDSQHSRSCTCGDMQFEAHTFSAWTKVDESTHSRTCSKCKKSGEATNYTETAKHTWVWVVDQEAALNQPGKQHEECTGCHAKRSENTEIPALRDYAVTVTGGTATVAAGTTITRAMEGVEVTVTADAPETGKVFDKWVVKAGGVTLANETSATTTFTMPGNDVKIETTYKDTPPSHTHSYGVYVGMTYTAGNFIYQITSIDTATLGQSKVIGVVAAKKNKITKVTIPDRADCKGYGLNVTAVGDNAFVGCKILKKLTIGNKVTVIGKNAFKKCSKLKTVVIGKAVKTISSKAFIGDNKIKKITFKGKKLKTVNKNAFSKKAKKNIKSKKTKLKGNKKAIKLFEKKLKIK